MHPSFGYQPDVQFDKSKMYNARLLGKKHCYAIVKLYFLGRVAGNG